MKLVHILLSILFLSLAALPGTASATDQNQAVKLCEKNPNCHLARGEYGVNLWGKGAGGNYEVYCPNSGPCQCLSCTHPARVNQAGGGFGTVVGVLTARSAPQELDYRIIYGDPKSGNQASPAPVSPPQDSPPIESDPPVEIE